jgi:hypothetical protein
MLAEKELQGQQSTRLKSSFTPHHTSTTPSTSRAPSIAHFLTTPLTSHAPSTSTTPPPAHQIDLIPGASLPNRAAYRTNPEETKEIQRQVQELLGNGYVRESLSPCVVSVILVHKKNGT